VCVCIDGMRLNACVLRIRSVATAAAAVAFAALLWHPRNDNMPSSINVMTAIK